MLRFIQAVAAVAALAFGIGGAAAASISIVSMQYSAAHPVPHLHYEGETVDGDVATLTSMFETFVKCRISCLGPDGGSTAILTMNGPGGSYSEGLALADFLRANHIATVVERGMTCYSACAFAFLGGSGYSSQDGIGTYIDRMVEPGSVVGFHAPYADEASFIAALNARGAMEAQGDTRNSLALMVKELVKWNVDPEVLFFMVGMGPDETYNLLAADDLYLARVALPPTPTASWITDIPSAVRNVCERLLAIDERGDPLDMQARLATDFVPQLGKTQYSGTISGYKLGHRLLDIGSCAVTDESAAGSDLEIALYYTPGIDGTNAPGTSFFNREHGWSSAGTGGNPVKRILQKGAMNSYFLPIGVPIDDLDLPGEQEIDKNRFVMALPPLLPTMPADLVVDASTPSTRISRSGDVWVFEQVGPRLLFDSAVADHGPGRLLTNDSVGDAGFIREGTFEDTAMPFAWFGFANGDATAVIHAIVIKAAGVAPTEEDLATLRRIQCAAEFQGLKLTCS